MDSVPRVELLQFTVRWTSAVFRTDKQIINSSGFTQSHYEPVKPEDVHVCVGELRTLHVPPTLSSKWFFHHYLQPSLCLFAIASKSIFQRADLQTNCTFLRVPGLITGLAGE